MNSSCVIAFARPSTFVPAIDSARVYALPINGEWQPVGASVTMSHPHAARQPMAAAKLRTANAATPAPPPRDPLD
jgi:hypothetical protein